MTKSDPDVQIVKICGWINDLQLMVLDPYEESFLIPAIISGHILFL